MTAGQSRVFVITGPSGVGKGSLISRLREQLPEIELSVSATTRSPRGGEVDGVDYHFLSPDEFERRVEAGEFLEHARYSGNRYGTLRSEVEQRIENGHPVVLEIEVQVFIAPPRLESLRHRLESRGTDRSESIEARLRVAEQEMDARSEFPHEVVNDDLDSAADELTTIVRVKLSESSA
jgi:guanylate kinase